MPWKLLLYLVLLGCVLAFVGLNLDHTADISLGFILYRDVPVFLSLFFAFFLGVVLTIPAVMFTASRKTRDRSERRRERREKQETRKEEKARRIAHKEERRQARGAARAAKASRAEKKRTLPGGP
ncbi:hypothetical protein AU468_01825 [Alkalispirochaeta sphaeroplastigenens]|uniref:Lipopolysaccharide assembly protein A domain-containing protein n=1 Tax=Alkalispirochaeta sphaeroplastigenens TaxID=1187066 RepID=A0A2S4K0F9_9SPIO|nr:lipopolysaccharide assembly protein LapA domain-containing protein [Alkalispirochaeta sphaeroplastigenens]POR05251.1 hypothetical protein AU468_01825 [Alkalispirochaeta sphaeroplastigenens]